MRNKHHSLSNGGISIQFFLNILTIVFVFLSAIGFYQIYSGYQQLEQYGNEIVGLIKVENRITDSLIRKTVIDVQAELVCISSCNPYYGESLTFELKKEIRLVIPQKEIYLITVRRTIFVGY